MKKLITLILSALISLLIFCSCTSAENHTHSFGDWSITKEATCTEGGEQTRSCSCGKTETKTIPSTNHNGLTAGNLSLNKESPYSELYAQYTKACEHQATYKCNLFQSDKFHTLLENMLCGKWVDDAGNYISYTYNYKDFDDKYGGYMFGNNLKTSKVSGNSYYYYINYEDKNVIIGYKDQITSEEKDNFIVGFNESNITVENKNDKKTYEFTLDENTPKVKKGNAKTAYYCIAKKIFDFRYPASVKVTQCYVEDDGYVYATIQAMNGYGATNNRKYRLYSIGDYYSISEYPHLYDGSNIYLDELNEKLAALVKSKGY